MFGMREREKLSQKRSSSQREKKEKKEIRSSLSDDDDDDVLLLAGDLSFSSENPTFGRTKEDEAGGKETSTLSLSFERDLLEKRVHI